MTTTTVTSSMQLDATAVQRPVGRLSSMAVIMLVGAVVRLVLFQSLRSEPLHIWDERDYNDLATNLVQYGEFTFIPGATPTSLRPPLYPAVVAVLYRVFGVDNFAVVRLLQAMLSLLTVYVVYRLAREISSTRVANWAAGICCFYPTLLAFNNFLLTEVLFTFLLTSACFLLVLAFRSASIGLFAICGVVLGLAALTRSVVWMAPPFLALLILAVGRGSVVRRSISAVTVVTLFALTIAPWAVRNTRLQQTFIAIDVMGGRNFMMGNYQYTPLYRSWDAISEQGPRSWWYEVHAAYPAEHRQTQGQLDKLALRCGLDFVRAHPFLTAQRSIVKFFDFWGLEREVVAAVGRGYFGKSPRWVLLALTAVIVGGYVITIFLGVFGICCVAPDNRVAHALFLCVIAFVCFAHTLVFGHSRYHLPLMPIVFVYAASALTQLNDIWRRRRSVGLVGAMVVCSILTAGWVWSAIAVDWELFVAALSC